jgi:hypothetical protein
MPAATAAAVPLDDPPAKRDMSQGLRAGGRGKSHDGAAKAIMAGKLADYDGAAFAEPLGHGRIPSGNVVDELVGIRRGRDALGLDYVLEANQNAVQRSAPIAGGDGTFPFAAWALVCSSMTATKAFSRELPRAMRARDAFGLDGARGLYGGGKSESPLIWKVCRFGAEAAIRAHTSLHARE